jgi:hypothetical protein
MSRGIPARAPPRLSRRTAPPGRRAEKQKRAPRRAEPRPKSASQKALAHRTAAAILIGSTASACAATVKLWHRPRAASPVVEGSTLAPERRKAMHIQHEQLVAILSAILATKGEEPFEAVSKANRIIEIAVAQQRTGAGPRSVPRRA